MHSFKVIFMAVMSLAAAAPQVTRPVKAHLAHLFPRQMPSKSCSHLTGGVHVIAVPGEGFADPPYGLIGTLAASILKSIPGSTNVSVPYDHTITNGINQTAQATATLNEYISEYHHYCPNTKIVLLGYSSGGIDVLNSLCGEGPAYPSPSPPLSFATYSSSVIAAVVYGEETRVAGQSYNRGDCTSSGLHPRPNPSTCNPWAGRMRSFCNANDPECCPANNGNISNHYLYPQQYDQRSTTFVVNRFKKSGGA